VLILGSDALYQGGTSGLVQLSAEPITIERVVSLVYGEGEPYYVAAIQTMLKELDIELDLC
jgi:hypothetical protein